MPLALIMLAIARLHLRLTIESIQVWLPLFWVAGVAAIVTSAAVAITADRGRIRYSGPERDNRTSARHS